jgi:hypothetical protein
MRAGMFSIMMMVIIRYKPTDIIIYKKRRRVARHISKFGATLKT